MPLPEWSGAFLAALEDTPNVTRAARQAGITKQRAYQVRAADPEFAAAWADALDTGVDGLESEAFRRAKDSSDVLMIFLLKCHRREVYGESAKAPEWVETLTRAITKANERKSRRSAD